MEAPRNVLGDILSSCSPYLRRVTRTPLIEAIRPALSLGDCLATPG